MHQIEPGRPWLTDRLLDMSVEAAVGSGPNARRMVSACLLDWTGCTIAGAHEPLVEKLVADAREFGRPGELPLLGRRERVGLRDFVLINGAAGHALDYDDGLPAMLGHPSSAIGPALLGLASYNGCSGRELVTAFLVAVEVAGRMGRLVTRDHYTRGFHATATCGAIAAAAGCAWLVGLDRDARGHAIGLAATRAAGLRASFGTEAKPLHAGWAALVGLTAAQWAQRGLTGARDVLDQPSGLRAVSTSLDAHAALVDGPPHILDVRFKLHAACAMTHPAIDATLRLRDEHALTPEEVVRVTITVDRSADGVCNLQQVHSGLQAKFSLRMVVAMALMHIDTSAPSSFTDEVVARPELSAFFDCVAVELVDGFGQLRSTVTVMTTNGTVLETTCDLGACSEIEDQIRDVGTKFLAIAAPTFGIARAAALMSAIQAIDAFERVAFVCEAASIPELRIQPVV